MPNINDRHQRRLERRFWQTPRAQDYWASRGLLLETAKRLGVGFGTAGFYENRITVPILSLTGEIVSWSGRAIVSGMAPKYYHLSYEKGRTLLGLRQSLVLYPRASRLILVEGTLDVAALIQQGWAAGAYQGAAPTDWQLALAYSFYDEVILWHDQDEAGRAGAARAAQIAEDFGAVLLGTSCNKGGTKDALDVLASQNLLERVLAQARPLAL